MASTYSAHLRLELITNGEKTGSWGTITNTNLGTLLEEAITGVASVVMTDANYTLTTQNGSTDEARKAVLSVTSSTLTATRDVIVPTTSKLYVVFNNTTGSQSIRVKTSAGTGITIANGKKRVVYCDGTNVVDMINDLPASSTINGAVVYIVGGTDVAIADGGTGGGDVATARTNFGLGTADSPQFAGINVGNATDTTISRSAAGIIAIEGVDVILAAGAQTLAGVKTFTNTPVISGAAWQLTFDETDGASNERLTAFRGNAKSYSLTSRTDADGAGANIWTATRGTGTAWASFTIGAVTYGVDGTNSAPTWSFTNDTNTGIYSGGADIIGFATAGTLRFSILANGQLSNVPLSSASTPDYSFSGDANTGFRWTGADAVAITVGGTDVLAVNTTGIVVTGTAVAGTFSASTAIVSLGSVSGATVTGPPAAGAETTGTMTSGSANDAIIMTGNMTQAASGTFAARDSIQLDPGTSNRTFTRGSGMTMYVNGVDSASATIAANTLAVLYYRSGTVSILSGSGVS